MFRCDIKMMLMSVKSPVPGGHSGNNFVCIYFFRSRWPRGLRRISEAACLLELQGWIPPGVWLSVSCKCCVLSGRGLCDGLNTRPEESYCVCVCVWMSLNATRCNNNSLHIQWGDTSQVMKERSFSLTHSSKMIYTDDPTSVTNIWRWVQTVEFLSIQFSPTSRYFRSITSKRPLFPLLLCTQNFPLGDIITWITGPIFYCPKIVENKLILIFGLSWKLS